MYSVIGAPRPPLWLIMSGHVVQVSVGRFHLARHLACQTLAHTSLKDETRTRAGEKRGSVVQSPAQSLQIDMFLMPRFQEMVLAITQRWEVFCSGTDCTP
ncbi:hypothetical protein ECG_05440 [Echinococcus granulosus]|nr:hypothetical protein ECG_05440 [Echinococcus granulosus]